MAYLDIDFTLPMIVLAAAIGGVVLVRQLTLLGERSARARTARLIARHGGGDHEVGSEADGAP